MIVTSARLWAGGRRGRRRTQPPPVPVASVARRKRDRTAPFHGRVSAAPVADDVRRGRLPSTLFGPTRILGLLDGSAPSRRHYPRDSPCFSCGRFGLVGCLQS